jgi:hypothetical protein
MYSVDQITWGRIKVFENNESAIVWKEAELNLRKYYYENFWNCRGEQETPLRISNNSAGICIWE